MASAKQFYDLSPEADCDLEGIFDYTDSTFGLAQARKYVSAFEVVFQQICRTLHIGKHRKEIRAGLRSLLVKEQHVVFYRTTVFETLERQKTRMMKVLIRPSILLNFFKIDNQATLHPVA